MRRLIVIALVAGLAACGEEARDMPVPEARATGEPAAIGGQDGPDAGAPASADAPGGAGVAGPRPVVYVDVRRPDEWAEGRVAGAIHIPHTELAERWTELEAYRDADIVLYCRTGRRSGIAERVLREEGFERLHNGGGLTDLARQGVPTER